MARVSPLMFLVVGFATLLHASPPERAIPDRPAQDAATAAIGDVYKPNYQKAKTPEQKIELAKRMIEDGAATNDDRVSRFVLFRVARDLAAQQGDLATSFDAIGRICQDFDADALKMKVDAAAVALKSGSSSKDNRACAALLAPLVESAVAADRFDEAASLAELNAGFWRDGRSPELAQRMLARQKEIKGLMAEFEKSQEAVAALEKDPTNPQANLDYGKFLCFAKGDWTRGVSMLALGGDESLKAVAVLELNENADVLKLADAWWAIAEGLEGTAQTKTQAHAIGFYRKALPGLTGLTKMKVEKLLSTRTAGVPTAEGAGAEPAPAKGNARISANFPGQYLVSVVSLSSKERQDQLFEFLADGGFRRDDQIAGKWETTESQVRLNFERDNLTATIRPNLKCTEFDGSLLGEKSKKWKLHGVRVTQVAVWQHRTTGYYSGSLIRSSSGGSGENLTFWSTGRIDKPNGNSKWSLKGQTLLLEFDRGRTARCTVSADGRSYTGTDSYGYSVQGTLITGQKDGQ